MKWENRGHEFDDMIERLRAKTGVILVDTTDGFSSVMKRVYRFTDDIKFYVPSCDINENDVAIITYEEFVALMQSKHYIAIICNREAYFDYANGLRGLGFEENTDFFYSLYFEKRILPVWIYATTNMIYADFIGHPQNWKCTLKCKECSVCIPYMSKSNTDYDEYIRQMDVLFSKIDYIYTYDLTGGETFITSDVLADVIIYLFKHYANRFGEILITTNATVVPSEKMLKILEACSDLVVVNISMYNSIPGWEEKCALFCDALQTHNIVPRKIGTDTWISMWNRDISEETSSEKAIVNYNSCKNFCRLYTDYGLYYCIQAYGANEAIYHFDLESEFIDLRDESITGTEILEFLAGYSEKGFMEICSLCKGYWENGNYVPVAEQLQRVETEQIKK